MSGGAPVLVTNDDGSEADGVKLLAEGARAAGLGPVLIVTPSSDVSGTGTAVGSYDDRWLTAHHRGDLDDAQYELPVYPAAIVQLAAEGGFGPPPRLVLAGVNHGENCGAGLLHSSTVGAALAAAPHGIPAVAVSAARLPAAADRPRWRAALAAVLASATAHAEAAGIAEAAAGSAPGPANGAARPWPYGGVLNVNLPAELPHEPSRIRWCRPARYSPWATSSVERETTADGDLRLRLRYERLDPARLSPADDGDTAVVMRGEVTLSWLRAPLSTEADPAWQAGLLAGVQARWPRTDGAGADQVTGADLVAVTAHGTGEDGDGRATAGPSGTPDEQPAAGEGPVPVTRSGAGGAKRDEQPA